jgi:cysteinyl-tRNA synthetase
VSAYYRSPINFSDESLRQAQSGLERLYNVKNNLLFKINHAKNETAGEDEIKWLESLSSHTRAFEEAMEDDMNTANAVSALFEMAKDINIHINDDTSKETLQAAYNAFMKLADILGILTKSDELLDEDIQKLIDERQLARKNKDFKRADELRYTLKQKGITLEDTKEGVKWKRN